MNQTLEQETIEEVSNYKLTFENKKSYDDLFTEDFNTQGTDEMSSITEDINTNEKNGIEECTSLVVLKERRLLAAQNMFKKSIKVSIKSFLISLSLSFLNLFI